MSILRLYIAGVAATTCVLATFAPVAAAEPLGPTLVASASFPNETAVQTVSYDLRAAVRHENLRIESRPSRDTLITVGPVRHNVRKHGRSVSRAMKPCVRTRVQASLYPGPWDVLDLARQLVPVAGLTIYAALNRSGVPLGDGRPPEYAGIVRIGGVARWKVGAQAKGTRVEDWQREGHYGVSAITTETTVLRVGGDCRLRKLYDQADGRYDVDLDYVDTEEIDEP